MAENNSPAHCATHVLRAFPVCEAGTEISSKSVVDYFFHRNIPPAQCVVGIRHCVASEWIQVLPDNRMRLLQKGVEFLNSEVADEVRMVSRLHH